MQKDSFFDTLREKVASMPARQRKVCEVILNRYQEAAFMTVEQLAEAAGVGVATVVRATRALGFAHYADMSSELGKLLIKRESSLWWQLENSWGENGMPEDIFRDVSQENIESIQHSYTSELAEKLAECVARMRASQKIAILGLRSTFGVASYFASLMMEFRKNVTNVGLLGSDSMFAALADLTSEDTLFAISLGGPYYAKRTHDGARFTQANGVPVISLVSDYANPITKYSDLVLHAYPTSRNYSVVSAVTILETLITAMGRQSKGQSQEKLGKLSATLKDLGVTS